MNILLLAGFITRPYLQSHPRRLFLFGDNAARKGMGGQAKEFRGEKNAYGIATKATPYQCFSDDGVYIYNGKCYDARQFVGMDFEKQHDPSYIAINFIDLDFKYLNLVNFNGDFYDTYVIPVDPQYKSDLNPHGISIGCGLAQMPDKCPQAFDFLMKKFAALMDGKEISEGRVDE